MLSTISCIFPALTELPTYKSFANADISEFPAQDQTSPDFLAALMSTMTHVGGLATKEMPTTVGNFTELVEGGKEMTLNEALAKTLWPEGVVLKASTYDGPDGKYLPESKKVLKASEGHVPFRTKKRVHVLRGEV